ncbi:anthranilate synthase component I [Paenibacillus sp. MMS18-CY102]|uniref:anthranilate synthase component I n=1 Tax=Paenibacillus sp. MMS18-CY102 TaxID=2682849 RepID=UPI001366770C|nr:anthranilate synthase component I [Paenibacillus sp. MMS18-CY102]MWC27603.1 anthranilate synthase component I [Paenibacillus sp. MMS18-CY102]
MSIVSKLVVNPSEILYTTQAGFQIRRAATPIEPTTASDRILAFIDQQKGALFSSSYEYPGRYSRWDIGFINPPLELRSYGKQFEISALNSRGEIILNELHKHIEALSVIEHLTFTNYLLQGSIKTSDDLFNEEDRTKQPSIFTVLRAIKELFYAPEDSYLGLYGAFGYDLVFNLESVELSQNRSEKLPDMVLYLPDELTIVDHQKECAYLLSYDFIFQGASTEGIERSSEVNVLSQLTTDGNLPPQYIKGNYAKLVEKAVESFKRGDLFEVVPTHSFFEKCKDAPSNIFSRLREINPSPYGFIINLGTEHLVGSSPEMYVRVKGSRVETCPISGTVRRGSNAIEDADRILQLLSSTKDEAELTMCTDVDRNDKSRICVPGSVNVIGRRQLEMYSHLIHTVDHVEGHLLPEVDALDAFISHMWAVTVTGAPKRNAIKWIEQNESSRRRWYGGAVGYYSFNGDLHTGLTLRTMRIQNGIADIRVGATLLFDSIPADEEEETVTKAAALVQAIKGSQHDLKHEAPPLPLQKTAKRILIVDHEDSFVHTLGNYFKQTGADILTARQPLAKKILEDPASSFDLVVLSPGPGTPSEFTLNDTIGLCISNNIPIFGVCLGLQGIVEYFGGTLDYLEYPMHGKSSPIHTSNESRLWDDLPKVFMASRYHSIHASTVPDCLKIIAVSDDQVVMAVEHKTLPISAVQFHPESILTTRGDSGLKIIHNVVTMYS